MDGHSASSERSSAAIMRIADLRCELVREVRRVPRTLSGHMGRAGGRGREVFGRVVWPEEMPSRKQLARTVRC